MKIKIWPDIPFWDELVKKSLESTFFHTCLWHDIVAQTYRDYSIASRGFEFDDGSRAIFPLIQTKGGGMLKGKGRLKSSVFGGYGGIIAERSLSEPEQHAIYAHLLSLKASISVDGNPFSTYSIPETFTLKKDFTHVFLLNTTEEDLYKRLSRGAKSNLNQAQKKGVSIRTARSEQDVSAYFGIYQNTLKRWGEATLFTYPEELFQHLFRRGGAAAKLWLAEKDGSIIAGAIIFCWNRVVSYWHGASLKDYFDCYPNNLLHMEIIKDALQKGYSYYDFGPSGGQQGVVRFKQSFGAEQFDFSSGHWKYRWKK
jgi:lipid II:glycine glycyltransferase (peptidoglycan interpeptide bridge formation enzyme)